MLKDNSIYLRRALVAASAKFTDLGDLSRPEFLRKIVRDGLGQGEFNRHQEKGDKMESMADYKKKIAREKVKSGNVKLDAVKAYTKTIKER